MDSNTKKFQTILLVILGVGLALGLMIFTGFIKSPQRGSSQTLGATGTIVIWGPFSNQSVSQFLNSFNEANQNSTVTYIAIDPLQYDEQLLEAFARGQVPDIIILPHTLIHRYKDKVVVLNEETIPVRSFRDLYSQGAEIFRVPEGTVGLPFGVDPLVMYYNRDIIESAGFVSSPLFWNDDFLAFTKAITRRENNSLKIINSAVALGESVNIKNSTAIISTLAMQLGSLMTVPNETGFEGVLGESSLVTNNPVASAFEYFTNFSNPSNDLYSWNREMSEARDLFASGRSAMYFGFASELLEIQRKNPNLNFDVSAVPQIKELNKSLTYGNFYSLAIPKIGSNTGNSFVIAGAIANGSYTSAFVDSLGIQPVRRDLLSVNPADPYKKIFYNAAIVSRAWIVPNPKIIDQIFSEALSAITSGRLTISRAVDEANQKINNAF